jgi:ribosomal protein S18 acetylase RimI-like enzyme
MAVKDFFKLENPVWHSLNETHKKISLSYSNLKCYHPDYCPFGGYQHSIDSSAEIDEYSNLISNFFIVGDRPAVSTKIVLQKELICLQMVIEAPIVFEIKNEITKLTDRHYDDLFDLVDLVQPGYFKKKTALLGDYFGILKDDKLIAVTGERMKMTDLTEVSAVVTHPDHTGKGYAKELVAFTVNKIFTENKTPFLHVTETNTGAIALYEKLGFRTRRKISFWNFAR